MDRIITTCIAGALALVLASCGGETGTAKCGGGTVYDAESGQCVAQHEECGDGQVHDAQLGRCVKKGEAYCGEGTKFDEHLGQCVVEIVECGEETTEEGGECLAEPAVACGEGTVVHQEVCRPAEDVCGPGTEGEPGAGDPCTPAADACGEGTSYDTATGRCISDAEIDCGPGTFEDRDLCLPLYGFYDELAADPDLDMTADGADGVINLPDRGELFSFVGTIDEPWMEDGQTVQDVDVYTFDGEAGQWLRVTLFSLGLTEPGFIVDFVGQDVEYRRFSDLGAGIETSRDLLLPADGAYELVVSNLPQLLETLSPAGGADWHYVGYVEVLEAPEPLEVDPEGDGFSGDLSEETSNLFTVDDLESTRLDLIFDVLPTDAEAELQLWSDAKTHRESLDINDGRVTLEGLDESALLYFDGVFRFGASTDYVASAFDGKPLGDGEAIVEQIELEAGEYVGVFQFNDENRPLSASISNDSDILVATDSLGIDGSDEARPSLYWYAANDETVTVEIENDTGEDIDFLAWEVLVESSESVGISAGGAGESAYTDAMRVGQRHYVELEVDFQGAIKLSARDVSAHVGAYDEEGESVGLSLDGKTFVDVDPQTYVAYVEVKEGTSAGVILEVEEMAELNWSESSEPGVEIPRGESPGASDTIDIPSCRTVEAIDMDVEILHAQRGDLVVRLQSPEGTMYTLKAQHGGTESDIIGNFNQTLGPNYMVLSEAAPAFAIDEFLGTHGTGTWTLFVADVGVSNYVLGTIESWTLNLECSG